MEIELPPSGLNYRVAPEVGIELIAAPTNPVAPKMDFEQDGLKSLFLSNFTGRIVFHRAEAPDASSVFTGSVLSSRAPSMREVDNPGSLVGSDCIEADLKFERHLTKEPPATPLAGNKTKGDPDNGNGAGAAETVSFLNAVALATAAAAEEDPPTKTAIEPIFATSAATGPKADPESLHQRTLTPENIAIAKTKAMEIRNKKRPPVNKSLSTQKALFRKVLNATQMKIHIPEHVQLARKATSMSTAAGPPPTRLHQLCAQSRGVTLDDLFDCLGDYPDAIKVKDDLGRYPLHILGDNEAMIQSQSGRETLTAFAGHIISENAAAAVAKDNDGFMPFCRIIADWIDWANDEHKKKKNQGSGRFNAAGKDVFYDQGGKGSGSSTSRWFGVSVLSQRIKLFPRVEVWEEVEWCFSMLSTVLDIFAREDALPAFKRIRSNRGSLNDARDSRTVLVQQLIGKLPTLVPTVFLVDDDGQDSRQRILDTVLFQRLFLCAEVVDRWLTDMLAHGGVPAKRAVDFLWRVSNSSIDDFTGGFGAANSGDWDRFYERREEVFMTVGGLKGIIASLVTLDNAETERAASTATIWHAMNNKLARPFVLGLVLIDLVLHLSLMIAFRSIAQRESTLSKVGVKPAAVVYFICTHYILRKGCEAWALLTVSVKVLKGYFSNLWNLFDSAAIILTLAMTIWHSNNEDEYLNGCNAFVMGLLWLKVLGFLKVVNKEMSTFILALSQILLDIRLFMVVLVVVVFMFGDMFHIVVSTKDDGQYCAGDIDSGYIDDFCGSIWSSYLRTYAILLGDFELDDITETTGTTLLFVIFTLVGVVILLNVLIAVISDSYEKATMSGGLLFGRARVHYVAQNEALERILKPRPAPPAQPGERRWKPKRVIYQSLRFLVLLTIIGTAMHSFLFLLGTLIATGQSGRWVALAFIGLLFGLLFVALWVVGTFILDNIFRIILPDRAEMLYDYMNRLSGSFVSSAANFLFGLNKDTVRVSSSADQEDVDWNGKVRYLENVIDRMLQEVKTDLKSEIMEMKTEMHDYFEAETG